MTIPSTNALVYSARALVVSWAAFWIWFGLASGIGEGLDAAGVLLHTAVPGLCFGLLALVAWRRETAGGSLLILAGLLIGGAYPRMTAGRLRFPALLIPLAMLAAPPLVSGILFVVHSRGGRRRA